MGIRLKVRGYEIYVESSVISEAGCVKMVLKAPGGREA